MSMVDMALEYQNFSAPEQVDNDRWSVKSLSDADWCVRKIAQSQRKIKDAEDFVKEEKARLDEFLAKVKAEQGGRIERFTMLLKPYAMEQIAGTKKRSCSVSHGDLCFRAQAPQYQYDSEELLAFCRESAPEFIKTEEKVDWANMKKALILTDGGQLVTADGELVPCTVEQREDIFSVKVKEL